MLPVGEPKRGPADAASVLGPLTDSRLVGRVIAVGCFAAVVLAVVIAVTFEPLAWFPVVVPGAVWLHWGYRYTSPVRLQGAGLSVSRWPGQRTSIDRRRIEDARYRQVASLQLPELMVLTLDSGRDIELWSSWGRPGEMEALNATLQDWRIAGAGETRIEPA